MFLSYLFIFSPLPLRQSESATLVASNIPSKVGYMIRQQISSMSDIFRWRVRECLSQSNFISIDPMRFRSTLDGFHLTVNKSDQLIPAVLIRLDPLTLNLFADTDQSFCYHTLTDLKLASSPGPQERKYRLQGDIYLFVFEKCFAAKVRCAR